MKFWHQGYLRNRNGERRNTNSTRVVGNRERRYQCRIENGISRRASRLACHTFSVEPSEPVASSSYPPVEYRRPNR